MKEEFMAENSGNSSSSVASVAIVVIVVVAIFAFYFLFTRGVSAHKGIDIDIKPPKHIEVPIDRR